MQASLALASALFGLLAFWHVRAQVAALATHPERSQQLRTNFAKRFPTKEAWQNRAPRAASSSYCTFANPGAPILHLFWDPIKSGLIAGHYKSLIAAIKARGAAAGLAALARIHGSPAPHSGIVASDSPCASSQAWSTQVMVVPLGATTAATSASRSPKVYGGSGETAWNVPATSCSSRSTTKTRVSPGLITPLRINPRTRG